MYMYYQCASHTGYLPFPPAKDHVWIPGIWQSHNKRQSTKTHQIFDETPGATEQETNLL